MVMQRIENFVVFSCFFFCPHFIFVFQATHNTEFDKSEMEVCFGSLNKHICFSTGRK